MPTYEWSCLSGHAFTARGGFEERERPCDHCDGTAFRAQVNRINFGGFARTPSEERDWSRDFKDYQEAAHELEYRKERLTDAMQAPVNDPLFLMAQHKANDLISKGATVDDLS